MFVSLPYVLVLFVKLFACNAACLRALLSKEIARTPPPPRTYKQREHHLFNHTQSPRSSQQAAPHIVARQQRYRTAAAEGITVANHIKDVPALRLIHNQLRLNLKKRAWKMNQKTAVLGQRQDTYCGG